MKIDEDMVEQELKKGVTVENVLVKQKKMKMGERTQGCYIRELSSKKTR